MGKQLPDLWDNCYDGEHRKLLAPEQFKQMFCDVCLNAGCRNSRGAGMKWSQRMLTQEDRLLNNPNFAPESAASMMGLPDFPDLLRDALRIEIADRKGDWEPVTDSDVGRAAAEMMGMVPPAAPVGFEPEEPEAPEPEEPEAPEPEPEPAPPEPEPEPVEQGREVEGTWRVRGDSKDKDGRPVTYTVTLFADGEWDCTCLSRENPCKHRRYIQSRLRPEPTEPAPDPVRPPPAPRRTPFPTSMNTQQPSSGVMVGGPPPEPEPDPWAVPTKPKERVIEVGGRVTFGASKKKK